MTISNPVMNLGDVYIIESEAAGVPALVGTKVRVEKVSGVSPFLNYSVITPLIDSCGDQKFMKIFKGIKPRVVKTKENTILCTMGIVARKQ
jgi:hypothetical protein